ncbi:hypothetical protein NDU88_000595 [Pleurodeles waltl]|uniref:Uncharacterized protein n=1 Tax=Pleurodeles waltl TaxID=8319 RepID=A0AAV7THP9_PLEWA|nr:hypothetical protein NDU88_000595 [Pleurodeles waltl]
MGLRCGMHWKLDQEVSAVERQLLRHESEVAWNPDALPELQAARKAHSELLEHLQCLNYAAHSANMHAKADRARTLLARLIRQETPP